MAKTYVLDTSVLLSDFNSITAFPKDEVVLPITVLNELDGKKTRNDDVGRNAREVIRILESISQQGSLSEGVILENKSKVRVAAEKPVTRSNKEILSNDDHIINTAVACKKENKNTILVTQDLNMRVKARFVGLDAVAYFSSVTNTVDKDETYTGVADVMVPGAAINAFYQQGYIDLPEKAPELFPNQFVVLRAEGDPNKSAIGIFDNKHGIKKITETKGVYGIKHKNKEQQFALHLLRDRNIHLVTMLGNAGTGKTLLALAAALEQVDEGLYDRVIITKPLVPVGKDLGYLPGNKQEKLNPWMGSIYDNLRFLLGDHVLDNYIADNRIEFEALSLFRGRSMPRAIILVDEAQNLNKIEVKTIITRAGHDSKIVMTADINQIDNPYVDSTTNGAAYCVEKLKGEALVGHITLIKGERSALATMASKLL